MTVIPGRRAAPWAALVGVMVAAGAIALWDPSDAGAVLCPWRAIVGFDCPLCGATRCMAALAVGDVSAAVDQNAFVVFVLLPVAAFAWWRWWRASRRTGDSARDWRLPRWLGPALLIGLLVWWPIRLAVPYLNSGIWSGA